MSIYNIQTYTGMSKHSLNVIYALLQDLCDTARDHDTFSREIAVSANSVLKRDCLSHPAPHASLLLVQNSHSTLQTADVICDMTQVAKGWSDAGNQPQTAQHTCHQDVPLTP